MKVVINGCYGGFSLSDAGVRAVAERKGLTLYPEKSRFGLITYWIVPPESRTPQVEGADWSALPPEERQRLNEAHTREQIYSRDIPRDDPDMVAVVEALGTAADGAHARLRVVEIPDGVDWEIEEYDGIEWVAEKHRTWK